MSELTGRSKDEALTALHDCDYDANRAVEILLERQDDPVCSTVLLTVNSPNEMKAGFLSVFCCFVSFQTTIRHNL